LYCNCQVHRDFLITLYYIFIIPNRVSSDENPSIILRSFTADVNPLLIELNHRLSYNIENKYHTIITKVILQSSSFHRGPTWGTWRRAHLSETLRDEGGSGDGVSLSEEALWRGPWWGAPSLGTLCRKCGTEEETAVHIWCECEALASLRHTYLGSFLFKPRGY